MMDQLKQDFLTQDIFPSTYGHLDFDRVNQFLDCPGLFCTYLFTPQGMAAIDACQMYLNNQDMVATCPWSSRNWKKISAKYLARLSEHGLTEADMVQCLQHYRAHRTEYAVQLQSWDRLQTQHLGTTYDAEQLIELFEMHGRDCRHPEFLERMAEISFDPINRAAVNEYLRSVVGKDYLDAIWTEMNNHLNKDANGDDQLRPITDLFAEDDDIEWLVNGVFPTGASTVLAGSPKAGKTSLARHLIVGLSKGTSWLNCDIPRPVKVGYFCCDDPKPLFRHVMRMIYTEVGLPAPEYLPHVQFSVNPSLLLKYLQDAVKQGMEFFILDTLFDAVNTKSVNDYAELKPILGALNRFCRIHNVHILCVHHDNKNSRGGTQDGILGSQAIAGTSAHNLSVWVDDPNDPESPHFIRSRNRYPDFLGGIVFRGQQFLVTQTGCTLTDAPTAEQVKVSKEVNMIVEIFGYIWAQREPVTKIEVENAVKGRGNTVRKLIDDLTKKEILAKSGKKWVVHPRFADTTEENWNQALLTYLKAVAVPVAEASSSTVKSTP